MFRNLYKHFFLRSQIINMNENKRYSKFDIGDWTYGYPNVKIGPDHGKLKIGKFCSIGPGVTIFLFGDHKMDWISTYPFTRLFKSANKYTGWPKKRGDIIIGNDVWIGGNALIMSGVNIGNGAVIGACSVITKDVPPYAIVVGNTSRVVRYRFNKEIIDKLQKIAWWDWPIEKIKKSFPLMLTSNIEAFIEKYLNELEFHD